ncbi:MAG: peptidase U32 family protein [Deltaproteobacteria bacterium]
MRLSVATNFDPALVEALRGTPVVELFGKLREDAVGGGRAAYQIARVSRKRLQAHVREARAAGISFNYLLNASCLGNREITRAGQAEIDGLCDRLCDIGVETVTVSSPFLLRIVKTRFPALKVRISVFAGVDRVRKARMWEEMGADGIVLDSLLVNREFETLARIREAVKCELELLVNNSCLSSCALSPAHMNALAHAGQSWHENRGFFIDWCFLRCTERKLRDPVNYLRSEWIRPEDIALYEGMGYDLFKVAERDLPTPVLVNRVRAYSARRYDGNLLDLVQPYALRGTSGNERYYRKGFGWFLRFLFRPSLVNPARMLPLKRLAELRHMTRPVEGEPPVVVDNRALDGFMERFREKGCRDAECETCRWCHDFAAKAVRIDPEARREALAAYDTLFRSLDGGGMWRYLPGGNGP